MYLVNNEDILQEQKNLLKQGYYLFHRQGNRILWLSSQLQWEVYASFETEEEAKKALEYIMCSYKECLECEMDPWRVKCGDE